MSIKNFDLTLTNINLLNINSLSYNLKLLTYENNPFNFFQKRPIIAIVIDKYSEHIFLKLQDKNITTKIGNVLDTLTENRNCRTLSSPIPNTISARLSINCITKTNLNTGDVIVVNCFYIGIVEFENSSTDLALSIVEDLDIILKQDPSVLTVKPILSSPTTDRKYYMEVSVETNTDEWIYDNDIEYIFKPIIIKTYPGHKYLVKDVNLYGHLTDVLNAVEHHANIINFNETKDGTIICYKLRS